jgi:hypothetical protein
MKIFLYDNFKTFLIIFSILTLTSVTSFWWLSFLSLIFFIWNFFNEKKKLRICNTFILLTVLLNICNFTVIIPTKASSAKVYAEWDKTGYDSAFLENAQESINIIDRTIEGYRLKYGSYPDSLSCLNEILVDNHDYSFRIKEADGQTNGVPFYYEKIDSNKFYLAGVGKDGKIKTDDDLLPQISKEQEKTIGLVKYMTTSFTPEEIDRERKVIEMFREAKKTEKLFNIE